MQPRERAIAVLVAVALFMEILDGTVVATAAPSIAASFGVGSADIGIVLTSYLLTIAVLIPLSGWVAERYGPRRVFLTAVVVFTLASVGCALAGSVPSLVAVRVLQGAAGAMMVPVGRLLVLRTLPRADIIKAIAYLTWPALTAPVLAPPIGGLITTAFGWEWIFLINVPVGVALLIAGRRLLPATRFPRPARLDLPGLGLTALGVGAAVAVSELLIVERQQWMVIAVATGVAGVAIWAATRHLLRVEAPLLDLRLLSVRTFAIPHAGGGAFRVAVNAVPFLLPLLFQDGFGWSAARAGTFVLFLFAGNLLIKPLTTPLLRRFGFRTVILTASICAAISTVLNSLIGPETPAVLIALILAFGGAARSVGFTGYNTLTYADITPDRMSQANTVSATLQQLAAGLGIVVGALVLRGGTAITASAADAVLPYRWAFGAITVLMLVATGTAWRIDRGAGTALRGRS